MQLGMFNTFGNTILCGGYILTHAGDISIVGVSGSRGFQQRNSEKQLLW